MLGWDGSVADVAATAFARELYDDLGKRVSVPLAAAAARRALLNGVGAAGGMADAKDITSLQRRLHDETELLRRDWHLARVWLGPEGGGPVVRGSLARSLVPAGAGHKVVLTARGDEKLEVADPAMFVGRRRELQRSLRVLAGNDKAGLLLHGMGRLGKSSLAARMIDRRPDLTPAVVFGVYDALSVADVLARALEEHPPARDLLAERKPLVSQRPQQAPGVADRSVGWAVPVRRRRAPNSAAGGRSGTHPGAGTPDGKRHQVRAAERPVLEALLHAFTPQRSESRLLLTSRYRFSLVEGAANLADRNLHSLELGEFGERAREKLSLRQVKAAQAAEDGDVLSGEALGERLTLLARAQTVARGNPGLQDLLGAELVLRPAVPVSAAKAALDEMEAYLAGGDLPRTEQVREFLQNLALDTLVGLAGPSGRALLQAVTVFPAPVPEAAIMALAALVAVCGGCRTWVYWCRPRIWCARMRSRCRRTVWPRDA